MNRNVIRQENLGRRFNFALLVMLIAAIWPMKGWADADSLQEKIQAVFFPYRDGTPKVANIAPGMKIDKHNAQVAAGVLPPELLNHLAAGEFSITVQETTDTPLRKAYIDATIQNYGKAKIGETELQNYVAGLPFPLLDPNDPQAGLKGGWNFRYRDRGANVQYWPTNEHRTGSGTVERSESYYILMLFGAGQLDSASDDGAKGDGAIYSKRYMRFLAPADAEGQQILSLTYRNEAHMDDQWLYDPKTRRTRKVVYNPYQAPGNGELLSEDTSGFNGYTYIYDWTYLGEKIVLAPSPIKSADATLGGKGGWYPQDPWELRKAIVLEAKSPPSHPMYSRRLLYLDAQTYANLYTFAYDLAGQHKRTFLQVYFHPQFNPWHNKVWLPQLAAQLSIDYQDDRASIFQTHKVVYNADINENRWFSVMGLMLYGK